MAEREERHLPGWGDLFVRTLELGLGAATLTVDAAQRVVSDLVGRGQVKAEESQGLLDRLVAMGHQQREQLAQMVEKATGTALARMDLARRSDLEALQQRVAELELAVLGHAVAAEPIPPLREDELGDNE